MPDEEEEEEKEATKAPPKPPPTTTALAEAPSLASVDLSGLCHVELEAAVPALPSYASYGAAAPATLPPLDKLDEARSAAVAAVIAPLFSSASLTLDKPLAIFILSHCFHDPPSARFAVIPVFF